MGVYDPAPGLLDTGVATDNPGPDMSGLQERFRQNWAIAAAPESAAHPPRAARDIWEAMEAGWQSGTTSLAANYVAGGGAPDLYLPENSNRMMTIASHAATMLGDVPAMLAGGAAGALAPIPGSGAAGAFAAPAFMRRMLMDHYRKGEIKTAGEFWDRASGAMMDAAKGAVTGYATAGAGAFASTGALGGYLTKAFGAGEGALFLSKTASEVGAMTIVGHGLEGKLPNASDFVEGAILVGGVHGILEGGGNIAEALRGMYAQGGIKPIPDGVSMLSRDPKAAGQAAAGLVPTSVEEIIDQMHREAGVSVDSANTVLRDGKPMPGNEAGQWTHDNPEAARRMSERVAAGIEQPTMEAGAKGGTGGGKEKKGDPNVIEGITTPLGRAKANFDEIDKKTTQAIRAAADPDSPEPTYKEVNAMKAEYPEWRKAAQEVVDVQRATIAPKNTEALSIPKVAGALSDALPSGEEWEDKTSQIPKELEHNPDAWLDERWDALPRKAPVTNDQGDLHAGQTGVFGPEDFQPDTPHVFPEEKYPELDPNTADFDKHVDTKWDSIPNKPQIGDEMGDLHAGQTGVFTSADIETPPGPAWSAFLPKTEAIEQAGKEAIAPKGPPPDQRTFQEKMKDTLENAYKACWDSAYALTKYSRMLAGKWLPASALEPVAAMRNRSGIGDRAMVMMGIKNLDGSWTGGMIDGATGKLIPNTKSWGQIISEAPDPNRAIVYALMKRAAQEQDGTMISSITQQMAEKFVKEHAEAYEANYKDRLTFENGLSKILVDSGIFSGEVWERLQDKDYVSVSRYLDSLTKPPPPGGAGAGSVANPIKEFTGRGGDLKIIDPNETVIKKMYLYNKLAETNRVRTSLNDLADTNPTTAENIWKDVTPTNEEKGEPASPVEALQNAVGALLEPPSTEALRAMRDKGVGQVRVMVDGEAQLRECPRDLSDLLNEQDKEVLPSVIKILSAPAQLERWGILNTPGFIARHAIRNPIMSLFFTENNLVPYVKNIFNAIGDYATNGKAAFADLMAAGGGDGIGGALDRSLFQHDLTRLMKEADLQGKDWNVLRNPLEAMHSIASLSDRLLKLADYKTSIEAGFEPSEAAARTRSLIPDRSRVGAQMRVINSLVPFFHMEWQSIDMLARAFYEKPGRVMSVAAGMGAATMLNWYLNKDDSRIKEVANEQRDLFWLVPTDDWRPVDESIPNAIPAAMARPSDQRRVEGGKIYTNEGAILRIPKPFLAGILFGSGTERVADQVYKDDPHAFDGYAASVAGALFREPIPAFAKPAIEQFANRSTFTGNPLVPATVEKELPQFRYNDYTTETAKALGKMVATVPWLGKTSSASPIVIENYVRSYAGTAGYMLLNIADKALRAAGVAPDKIEPTSTWADNIFTQAFIVRNPGMGMQGIRSFYDSYGEFQQIKFTMQQLAREGNRDEAQRLQQMEQMEYGSGTSMDALGKALSVNAHLIRTVYENPTIKPYEKRQLIDGYYYMMSAMADQGNRMVDQIRKVALQ